jgi:hypothetical protein
MFERLTGWSRRVAFPQTASTKLGFGAEYWDPDPTHYEGWEQLRDRLIALGRTPTKRDLAYDLSSHLLDDVIVAAGGVERAIVQLREALGRLTDYVSTHNINVGIYLKTHLGLKGTIAPPAYEQDNLAAAIPRTSYKDQIRGAVLIHIGHLQFPRGTTAHIKGVWRLKSTIASPLEHNNIGEASLIIRSCFLSLFTSATTTELAEMPMANCCGPCKGLSVVPWPSKTVTPWASAFPVTTSRCPSPLISATARILGEAPTGIFSFG